MKLSSPSDTLEAVTSFFNRYWQAAPKLAEAALIQANNIQQYWAGIFNYTASFNSPASTALDAFLAAEKTKVPMCSPEENMRDYMELLKFNFKLAGKGMAGSLNAMGAFYFRKMSEGFAAVVDTFWEENGKDVVKFASEQETLLKVTVREYPKAIHDIKSEYGFHFDHRGYLKVAETERFELWQVLPTNPGVVPSPEGKPILIIPPYVVGANILAFLPGEQRSYVHCFANQGIPTYIRIVKDIRTVPAVQVMTGEDDATDIRLFCEQILSRHGRQITLNGFCQGGYHSLAAILSGELDGLVDAFITCATPVDGSRSKSLVQYMNALPTRFRDLSYSLKTLPNGNQVVDGAILSWVYKLRKMESESPIPSFHRDLSMFDMQRGPQIRINKTAAAVNHWLTYDQVDLPVEITKMVFDSYTTPIDENGTLPVKLFGRVLNLHRLVEKGIPWLICIADNDDLVDKEASLVALNYIDAEVCVFPKGHASLATSWSIPTSECALQLCFCYPSPVPFPPGKKVFRGPVRFQLDLQGEQEGPGEQISQGTDTPIEMKPEPAMEKASAASSEIMFRPEIVPVLRAESAVPMKVMEQPAEEPTGATACEAVGAKTDLEQEIGSGALEDEKPVVERPSIVPEFAVPGSVPDISIEAVPLSGAFKPDVEPESVSREKTPETEPVVVPEMAIPGIVPEIALETAPAPETEPKAPKQRRRKAPSRTAEKKQPKKE